MNQYRNEAAGAARSEQAVSPAQTEGNNQPRGSNMERRKYRVFTSFTPAKFPYLNRPDTHFDREKGVYSVHLVMDPARPSCARFIARIEKIAKTTVGDGATIPIKDDLCYGAPTGLKLVKFVSRYPPKIVDMAQKPLDAEIGAGSVIRVIAIANIYHGKGGKSGVTLRLVAVQVKKLVEPSGYDAFGFADDTETSAEAEASSEEPTIKDPAPIVTKAGKKPASAKNEIPF